MIAPQPAAEAAVVCLQLLAATDNVRPTQTLAGPPQRKLVSV